MKIYGKYQIGSTISYSLVGIAIALVFVGTVYFVGQRSQQVRKSSEIAKTTTKKPAAAKVETTNTSSSNATVASNKQTNTSASAVSNNNPASTLPETGPADPWMNIFAASLLIVVSLEFIASRRARTGR